MVAISFSTFSTNTFRWNGAAYEKMALPEVSISSLSSEIDQKDYTNSLINCITTLDIFLTYLFF